MDITFNCPKCKQELVVDASGAGSEIQCPECENDLIIPEADPRTVISHSAPITKSAAALEAKKNYAVPTYDDIEETLIEKPKPTLEVAAKESDKKMRIKLIRHSDCMEVGRDHFEQVVNEFFQKIGEKHIMNIHPFNYQHLDIATQKMMHDYGIMIVFKG